MPLPADLAVVTVTGTYVDDDGDPLSGNVVFAPSVPMLRDPAGNLMVSLTQIKVTLDAAGSFSVDLIATDDPDAVPANWYYQVTEHLSRRNTRAWMLLVPYGTVGSLDIADAPSTVIPPVMYSAVSSVVGQTGNVTGAQILADPTIDAAMDAKVPYTGATSDLVLGANDLTAASLSATGTVSGASVSATGAVSGASVSATGTVSGASVSATGAVSAGGTVSGASLSVTGEVGCGSVDSSGSVVADNVNYNEGSITDPTVTDLGGLSISVSSVDCLIRSDSVYGNDGVLYRRTVPAATLSVVDESTNHIYVAWNSGSPIYVSTTDRSALNLSNNLPVARLYVTGGVVHSTMFFGYMGRSAGIRLLLRTVRVTDPVGAVHESGLALSETTSRVINIAAGTMWFVLKNLVFPAIRQGDGGVTTKLCYHSAGVWTKADITQYNNTQYDNGTNLATLTSNRYAVNWVYRSLHHSEIVVMLGTGDYTASDAIASSVPSGPACLSEFYYLCGRIIVKKGESTAYLIENTNGTHFAGTPSVAHNDLTGIQGGIDGERYHLDATQYAAIGGLTGYVPYSGASSDLDLGSHSAYGANLAISEGMVTDPTISDAAGVAVAVTQADVLIRSDALWDGDYKLYRKTVAAVASLAVTDNALNYIYVDWNSGTPIYAATTNRELLNHSTRIPVGRVYMSSGSIEYKIAYGYLSRGGIVRNIDRIFRIRGMGGTERESGFAISESATRVVTVASGYCWFGLSRIALDAVTQGGVGVSSELWYHSAGVWTATNITQYNNTQYDNGTNLVALTSGRYAVNWIWRNITTGGIDITLGTGDYTLAQAEASTRPAIPDTLLGFYLLVGRIIVKNGASTATSIESVATTTFNQSAVSIHNDLSGIQGGATGDYQHLTTAQVSALGTATSITSGTPASGGATGTAGQILYDANRLYICTATNTWKYVTLSALP